MQESNSRYVLFLFGPPEGHEPPVFWQIRIVFILPFSAAYNREDKTSTDATSWNLSKTIINNSFLSPSSPSRRRSPTEADLACSQIYHEKKGLKNSTKSPKKRPKLFLTSLLHVENAISTEAQQNPRWANTFFSFRNSSLLASRSSQAALTWINID